MSKENLHLPKTAFSMKANLPNKEPAILEKWEKNQIFKILRKNNYTLKFKSFVNYIFVKNENKI